MQRFIKKRKIKNFIFTIISGIFISVVINIFVTMSFSQAIALFCLVTISIIFCEFLLSQRHKARLIKKYNNESLAYDIENNLFWRGQTADQLVESIGIPERIDQTILNSRTNEIWKYGHQSNDCFKLTITLSDGIVNDWNQEILHKNITPKKIVDNHTLVSQSKIQ